MLNPDKQTDAALEAVPKPTIAAVHGVCSSGGLELALGFEYLWAAVGTKIGFLEPMLAIPPLAGGVQRIAARAGSARAMWNIVNRIVPADSLHREAEAFAERLAEGPTRAYGAIKAMLRVYEQDGIPGADRITIQTVAPLLDSSDAKAAISTLMTQGSKAPFTYTGT
jgi:enoyl-CoA hydratase/carnithine racemase